MERYRQDRQGALVRKIIIVGGWRETTLPAVTLKQNYIHVRPAVWATFVSKDKESDMTKYVCIVCGWVYDPQKGDPDNGVAPGTAFADIPDDWVCPECGAEKDQFEPQE